MKTAEEVEKAFEKVNVVIAKAMTTLEGVDGDCGDTEGLVENIQRLSDSLHNKLSSIPKDVDYVRLSRLNMATLIAVLNNWARDIGAVTEEFSELGSAIEEDFKSLTTASDELLERKDKILELLDKHAPELDITSELRDAERT